jgi:signal transduction histidine kinase
MTPAGRPGDPGMSHDQAAADEVRLARLSLWDRLEEPVWGALPYLLLVVASVLEGIVARTRGELLAGLGLAAAVAAWLLWGYTFNRHWREQPRRLLVFFAGLVILLFVLVTREPVYGFCVIPAYYFAFALPYGRRRLLALVACAIVGATSQDGGLPRNEPAAIAVYAGLILLNVVVIGGITWFLFETADHNDARARALAELSEANRKLEATLEENAGLHEQLVAQAREAGVYDERQRMAREIHDTLAQSLAGIITQLQAADQAVQSAEQRRHRDAALGLARDGLSEARRSVRALRPEPLQQAGRIEDALAVVAARWSELHGVQAAVTTTGPPRPIPAEAELVLLRTAQEALANVARHARARAVRLTLSYIGDQVTLDVRDDGSGFTPPAGAAPVSPAPAGAAPAAASPVPALAGSAPGGSAPAGSAPGGPLRGGFGLTAMRERVEGLAGTLAIESEPGAGTTISASLPVPAPGGAQ